MFTKSRGGGGGGGGGGGSQMIIEHGGNDHQKHQIIHPDNPSPDQDCSFRLSNTSDILSPPRYSPDHHLLNSNARPSWDQSSTTRSSWDPSSTDPSSSSPLSRSPWHYSSEPQSENNYSYTGLMGSLVREEGHIYSLAATGDLLYAGSDSKNIRVWKNQKEFSSFKSNSGLVKAIIIIADDKIFTGHQDGKIRVWKTSGKNPSIYKRIGTLPTLKASFKKSINPNSFGGKKNNTGNCIKHMDAISSLSLSEDRFYLYSASWDKTIKVWRASDSKFLETIIAHDDAVNSVVAGFDNLIFTGSADGTVKVWRRELQGKGTKHFFSQTLLKQECAVTALAIDPISFVLYCGSSDGLVNFWERDKHLSHGGVLRGHKLAVLCLAAVMNLVFSGSADTSICVWRMDCHGNHDCLTVLNGHSGPVKCLAVEERRYGGNGRNGGGGGGREPSLILYSGSLDKSVKIWRVSADSAPDLPHQIETETLPSFHTFSSQNSLVRERRHY